MMIMMIMIITTLIIVNNDRDSGPARSDGGSGVDSPAVSGTSASAVSVAAAAAAPRLPDTFCGCPFVLVACCVYVISSLFACFCCIYYSNSYVLCCLYFR